MVSACLSPLTYVTNKFLKFAANLEIPVLTFSLTDSGMIATLGAEGIEGILGSVQPWEHNEINAIDRTTCGGKEV